MATRKYELKQRAETLAETRRRITEATVALHLEVGPAATRISEIARRAGVQRATVYSHFPDDASLFAACSAHWTASHAAPDPAGWTDVDDPGDRLRVALRSLYEWYRETEPMLGNVLRDMELLPALREVIDGGFGVYLERVRASLAEPFHARGRARQRLDAALRAATEFRLWQALAPLGDGEACELAAALVEAARPS